MLRSEIDATRRLPHEVPAPRLLHVYDDGDWIVGVFEHVDGHMPGRPWVPNETRQVLSAVRELGTVPLAEATRALPTAEDRLANDILWLDDAGEHAVAARSTTGQPRISTISSPSKRGGPTRCAGRHSSISTSGATTSSSSRPDVSCSSIGRTRASAPGGWTCS